MKYHEETRDGDCLSFATGRGKRQTGIPQSPFSEDELYQDPIITVVKIKV